jgi:hypothetical protein
MSTAHQSLQPDRGLNAVASVRECGPGDVGAPRAGSRT